MEERIPVNEELKRYAKCINPEAQANEISRFEKEILRLEQQQLEPDDFKKFRLENGVYGIRGVMDEHMIRIKVRYGVMDADQLEAVADIVEKYATPKVGHVTTRQAIQLHKIKRHNVPAALKHIAETGLTAREACGNTVRNVTACPFAGISAEEAFDVIPYADAVSRYFLRNPVCQNLPRKFKIAFEGCPTDHARVPIHDFGAVARVREIDGKQVRGFATYVGGGLGTVPFAAHLLEEFTPVDLLIPTIEAVIRLFDRHGDRKNRATARIKFVIKKWGIDEFRTQFAAERKAVLMTSSGKTDWEIPLYEQEAPPANVKAKIPVMPVQMKEYERWRQTNLFRQKQTGYTAVQIRCVMGDITVEQMRGAAAIAREFNGGRIRTMITQNILLPWIREEAVPAVYQRLVQLGIAQTDAGSLADITRCPGADTCQIAITHSRGLAVSIGEIFSNGSKALLDDVAMKDLTIKISGCPNSCGQHHIADIGFHGAASQINGHAVPHYIVMVGGRTAEGVAEFGLRLGMVPAKRVPEATKKLLTLYRDEHHSGEAFRQWVHRVGVDRLKTELDPIRTLPAFEQSPEMYEDLGAIGEFKLEVGKGECAT
ncbi:MAG: nitrite/sulfite reductase [Candidatus Omnitrophica bacterium]|nr:nitrite/sulfite reductase [Candidatus Omnitrophota bacterium]